VKKHSSKKKSRFKAKAQGPQSKQRTTYMKPEDLVVHVRRAEKEALPTIKELEVSAGAAIFLVAQYTQAFVSGKPHLTLESATSITNSVIALWQSGSYQPGPEYPFSLEETLLDLKNGMGPQKDYSESFQPFKPSQTSAPVGLGQIAGGIVQHPKTHLWQIWMMLDNSCQFLGVYRDPSTAQKNLEDVINAVRHGEKPAAAISLYQKLMSQADNEPQQISFDMMNYLIENMQQYTILL
jgi:hypothetical protein